MQVVHKTLDRRSAALACKRVLGSHTFDNIAELFDIIHKEFVLTNDKIVVIVTDNGSNFIKAFKEFGLHDSECFATDN